MKNLSHNILIGNDHLKEWGITIDFKLGYLWTDDRTFFKFNIEEENSNCGELIYTINDIVIPARTNIFLKGFIKYHPSGRFTNSRDDIIIEGKENQNYLITRSIYKTTINPTINFGNYLDTPLHIKKGVAVAISYSNCDNKVMNINMNNNANNIESPRKCCFINLIFIIKIKNTITHFLLIFDFLDGKST